MNNMKKILIFRINFKSLGRSMSHLKLLILLTSIFVFTGCSTFSGLYTYKGGPVFENVKNIPEGMGVVYIYRPPSFAGGGKSFKLWVGSVISEDDIHREWTGGNNLTILYKEGWVRYSMRGKATRFRMSEYAYYKNNWYKVPSNMQFFYSLGDTVIGSWIFYGDGTSILPADHELFKASREGIPIIINKAFVNLKKSGCYYPHIVEAGEVICWSDRAKHEDARFNVKPGEASYMKIAVSFYGEVPPSVGENEIIKCSLLLEDKK